MSYKYKYKNKSIKPIYTILIILLLLVILYIYLQGGFLQLKEIIPEQEVEKSKTIIMENATTATLEIPAIDTNGNGISTTLTVVAKPGTGKVLTDIEVILFWVDTQQSIQIAKKVAKDITGIDTDKVDLEYSIKVDNATIVGGPSAGAALTIATIAVLQNKTLKKDVTITGTINPDGTIGKVGAVIEKAKAAKDVGIKTFLVPPGESTQNYIMPDEKCIERPGFIYCETVYREKKVNIGESIGIEVKEVGNIKEALEYFL